MTAAEARKRTDESLRNGSEIRAFIEILDRRIGQLADAGHNKIEPWQHLSTQRLMHPRPEQKEVIKQHYIAAGFGWEEYPDPDPGHPGSGAYTHITW